MTAKMKKVCENGHTFYKSSDCPVCPVCESEKSNNGIFKSLGAPAKRALEDAGIRTAKDLSRFSKKDILALHGFGPSSIPKLEEILIAQDLKFRQ